jgi:hypothetical protein
MKEYYGDETRWFIGMVIDVSPPAGLEGRVRVRIHGVHSPSTKDIPQKDLPWAQVMVPSTEGGSSGIGANSRIKPYSTVFGVFMDGKESQIPLILGTIPKIESPSGVQKNIEFLSESLSESYQNKFYNNSYTSIDVNTSGVDDDNGSSVNNTIRKSRESTAIKFFLNNGYTFKQSIAIVAGIKYSSRFNTGQYDRRNGGIGLCSWTGTRLTNLKEYSNDWNKFSVQLSFILYELNTTKTRTNFKIKSTDKVIGDNVAQTIVAKNYLDLTNESNISSVVAEGVNIYSEYENG